MILRICVFSVVSSSIEKSNTSLSRTAPSESVALTFSWEKSVSGTILLKSIILLYSSMRPSITVAPSAPALTILIAEISVSYGCSTWLGSSFSQETKPKTSNARESLIIFFILSVILIISH